MEENSLESFEGIAPVVNVDEIKQEEEKPEKFDFHKWFNKKKIEIKNLQISSMYDVNLDVLLKLSGGRLNLSDNFNKVFSSFLLCRYLSMDPKLIDYACALSIIVSRNILSEEEIYKFAYHMIPKNKTEYVAKYIKKSKKDKKNNKEEKEEDISFRKDTEVKNTIFDI